MRSTEIDQKISFKIANKKSVEEYHESVSSYKDVKNIAIPSFFYFALDDPLIGTNSIPQKELKENPWVMLGISNYGSHLCCFESVF